jgi:hypothetical protein
MMIQNLRLIRRLTPRKWEVGLVGSSSCELNLKNALASGLIGTPQITAYIHVISCAGSVLQLFDIWCYRSRFNPVGPTFIRLLFESSTETRTAPDTETSGEKYRT